MAASTEPAFFQEARSNGLEIVTEAPKFDLDSFIANYSGKAKIFRLAHIGRTSTFMYREALTLALAAAKEGKDVELYEQIVQTSAKIDPADALSSPDTAWVARTSAEAKAESDRLERELKGYKNNLIKESIRMGYDEAGCHYQEIGQPKEAEKAFGKEREFCQTPSHVAIMNSRLLSVFIERKSWMTAEATATKIRDVIHSQADSHPQRGIVSAITGLAQMSMREYQRAANSFIGTDVGFLQTKPSQETVEDPAGLRSLISPNDVATYGAICALASMERDALRLRVLGSSSFRQFLELEPHLRRAISAFVGGKFSQCLAILQSYRADYLLDVNLYPHFSALYERIRNKAIVQFFIPFSRVTFQALSAAFNVDEDVIQATLVDLIKSRQLAGRLDLEKRVLVADTKNERNQAHQEALESARDFERTTHQRILRMETIAAGLEVRLPKPPKAGAGGSSGPGDIHMGGDAHPSGRALRIR